MRIVSIGCSGTGALAARMLKKLNPSACCAGQPELSPDPGKEPLSLAAEEADMLLSR